MLLDRGFGCVAGVAQGVCPNRPGECLVAGVSGSVGRRFVKVEVELLSPEEDLNGCAERLAHGTQRTGRAAWIPAPPFVVNHNGSSR